MNLTLIVFASLVFGTPIALIGGMIAARRRGARRNRQEVCAYCAGPLYVPESFEGPSLLEGLQICSRCAARQRVRIRAELALIALFVSTSVVALTILAAQAGGFAWLLPVLPVVEYGLMFGGAAAWMKRANRRKLAMPAGATEIRELPRMGPTG